MSIRKFRFDSCAQDQGRNSLVILIEPEVCYFQAKVGIEVVGSLHRYAGVIPFTYSSDERSYHGRIIKEGNQWLRWAAVEAVWPAIRAEFDLRRRAISSTVIK